jgi:orotidine-5'-phosphate decarboxylase
MVENLGDTISFYKIGLQLFLAPDGRYFDLASFLSVMGKKMMVDLKMLDVPRTVAHAVDQLKHFRTEFATVHAQDEAMIKAAASRKDGVKILAVTVLTSLTNNDIWAQGFPTDVTVSDLVLSRTKRALELGCDGVVASGQEAGLIREQQGDDALIVAPGIRPPEAHARDDQQRTVDVEEAFDNGADYIVVGRPIRLAPNPKAKADEIQGRISKIFGES